MNRLCPTFPRVGVSYRPARLTFSRRSHPWPGQHRGDVVGVADSISTHVVDESLATSTTTQKFVSTVAPFRWENKVVSPRMPNRRLSLPLYALLPSLPPTFRKFHLAKYNRRVIEHDLVSGVYDSPSTQRIWMRW